MVFLNTEFNFFLDSSPLFYWKQWERITLTYHQIMVRYLMEMRKEQEELQYQKWK